MPIIGKTDKDALADLLANARKGIAVIGKLRKGTQKKGDHFGDDLPYFRFTSDRPEVLTAFNTAFGKEPKSVEVVLVSDRADLAFETWREKWTASVMDHRCDGQRTTQLFDRKTGVYVRDPARQTACPGGCKQVGRLSFVVLRLLMAGYGGIVTLETHSDNDIRNIWNALSLREENGLPLAEIVWNLYRAPTSTSVPMSTTDPAKRGRTIKHLCYIEPWSEYEKNRLKKTVLGAGLDMGFAALKPIESFPVLASGVVAEPPEDDESEDGEYFDHEETKATNLKPAETADGVKGAPTIEFLKSPAAHRTKGVQYLDMPEAQLLELQDHPQATEAQKEYAKFLLEVMADDDTVRTWADLVKKAGEINEKLGSEVIPILDVDFYITKRTALRSMILELEKLVKENDVPF